MSKKEKPIKAWHFCRADMKTQYTGEPVTDGGTLYVDGEIELCERGLHASLDVFDALKYAPGPILCRVELSGNILRGDDKLCASRRKVLWHMNVDHLLHEFACLCAERALKAAGVKDERSHNAIKVKRLWLQGESSDEELAAARAAAQAAALAAAQAAAWAAARAAAWAAAWAAARAAAWDAETKGLRKILLSLVGEQARKEGKKI